MGPSAVVSGNGDGLSRGVGVTAGEGDGRRRGVPGDEMGDTEAVTAGLLGPGLVGYWSIAPGRTLLITLTRRAITNSTRAATATPARALEMKER